MIQVKSLFQLYRICIEMLAVLIFYVIQYGVKIAEYVIKSA